MKKNVVIIILSILVLSLGGYLVYDKVLSSDNKEEIIEKEDHQEEDYDIVAAQFIMDSFLNNKMINVLDRISQTKLDEETKLAIAITNTDPAINSYTCADFFDINTSYGDYRPVDKWACISSDIPNSYNYEDVNKQYKKFFGSSKEAPKQGVLYDSELYDYSKKKDFYVKLAPQFGPIRSNLYYYEAENAKVIENELKIKISYLTYHYASMGDMDSFSYYIGETLYEDKTFDDLTKSYNDNKKALPNLTFVFEKENNNYILKSVE